MLALAAALCYIRPTCVGMNSDDQRRDDILQSIRPTCVGMNRITNGNLTAVRAAIRPTCVGMNRAYAEQDILKKSSAPRAWG